MGYKTEKKIPSIILSVFIVLLILVGTIVPAYAAPTQDMMVTDSGEMLSDREEQEVSEMLYSINRQTGIEYLVYTIKSLNGEDIETCANRLFRTAGLGDKEKDNGLLLLISYDDRKFRLEVGYGLEGDIPDTQAANIINTMTPYFKEGNYGDGVKAAVKQTAVILNSSGEYTISEDWAAQAASNDEATAFRENDDNELESLSASISVPVENDDEVIGNTLGEEKLIVHAVAALYNLISDLRPNWLDNEDTSLTLDISIDGRKAQSCGGLVAMKEEGFTFGLED